MNGTTLGRVALATVIALITAVVAAGTAPGQVTTEQRTLTRTNGNPFRLRTAPGWPRVVRQELAPAQPGRNTRRTSLLYFGQLTDFQLADEESPARVEWLDLDGTPFTGAQRPQEALNPFMDDQAIRAVNQFVGGSPILQGNGTRATMAFGLTTGDSADNMQRNEVNWVVGILEGLRIDPNSGVNNPQAPCAAEGATRKYTGVQDRADYLVPPPEMPFYDPNQPEGRYAAWPRYPGLMNRAQQPFMAAGLAVPSYVAFGNHDGLVQGNAPANRPFEDVATGCLKVFGRLPLDQLAPATVLASPTANAVPPDPDRQFVDKRQYEALHVNGTDQHGFGLVDPAERAASRMSAGYYSFVRNGIRMIALDTVSVAGHADGNIDDPQFQWLTRELDAAETADQLVILFGHHPIRTLTIPAPDEAAPPCTVNDAHLHDVNPGCDADPRLSTPIHLGSDLQALALAHPHVIAYVAGHTHEHKITPFARPGDSGFWGIETSSETDWPIQSRLIDVMDNHDLANACTLSIFGTLIDHAGPIRAPAPGTSATGLSPARLASIGRTLSANDFQAGEPTGIGTPPDRNVELLVKDPRFGNGCAPAPPPPPPPLPLPPPSPVTPIASVGMASPQINVNAPIAQNASLPR